MKTTTEINWWQRLCAWCVGRRPIAGTRITVEPEDIKVNVAARDATANDKVLMDVKDDHPVFRVAMDYLCVGYEDNLDVAMSNPGKPDVQRDYLNRAAGIRDVIGNIHTTRSRLIEERKRDQARQAKREEKKT